GVSLAGERTGDLPRLLGDRLVISVARGAEHLLHLLVVQPLDEPRLDQRRIASALDDLAQDPVQVLLRLLARGQGIDRVLDSNSTELLQPPPDLDAEVARLGRNLMNEQEPPRIGRGFLLPRHTVVIVQAYLQSIDAVAIESSAVIAWSGGVRSAGRGGVGSVLDARSAPLLPSPRHVRIRRPDRARRLHAARPGRGSPLDLEAGLPRRVGAFAALARTARSAARDVSRLGARWHRRRDRSCGGVRRSVLCDGAGDLLAL